MSETCYMTDAEERRAAGVVRIPIFPIGGHTDTVTEYRKGLAGQAYALDVDLWDSIPTVHGTKTINPLYFILQNILKNNLSIIKLKTEAIPEGTDLRACFSYLKKTIPAGTSYLIFTEKTSTLLECPASCVDTEDMVAFYVAEDTEDVTGLESGRTKVAAKVF